MTTDQHQPDARHRARFMSTMIRGGFLERRPTPVPNIFGDATYALRIDTNTDAVIHGGVAVWLAMELSEAERRQWADTLLEGL